MPRATGFFPIDVIRENCLKYPDLPSKTLARMVLKNNPNLFKSLDAVRSKIRYARGAHGGRDRKALTDKSLFDTKERSRTPFKLIPEGLKDLGDWTPVDLYYKKILVLSDLHIPYHDKKALEIALEDGKKNKIDCVLLNGDAIDFYQLSRFEKDPRNRDVAHEVETFKKIMTNIKSYLKVPIIFKLGNHDERYTVYMMSKAPALFGHPAFTLETVINNDFDGKGGAKDNGLNIKIIGGKKIIKIGKLNIVHGHEFGKSVFSPVNPARGLFMRGKECALQGHNHQTSHHTETTMNGELIATWSSGCLCDLHPSYLPINNWNHGFSIIEQNKNGFLVYNKKIIGGKIYQ